MLKFLLKILFQKNVYQKDIRIRTKFRQTLKKKLRSYTKHQGTCNQKLFVI